MLGKEERLRQDSKSYRQLIVNWVAKLATHFHQEQTVEQYEIFLEHLVIFSDWQIEQALERCITECTFMPKLAEIRARMPEQRQPWKTHEVAKHGQPILYMNVLVARMISVSVCGREYDSLDPMKAADQQLIIQVMGAAQKERLKRGWINAVPGPEQMGLGL